jgi:C-terminal processing protease CtpA/Prc
MFADTPWDKAGVYSGNIIIGDDGVPTAVYTGNVAGQYPRSGPNPHGRQRE